MKATISVYKTLIDPNNTIVFIDETDRDEYFYFHKDKLELGKCSFNGSRNVRINGYYEELITSGYNYCSIKTDTTILYCFIDNYVYVNDNCSELYLTIDYLTTYLFEYYTSSVIKRQYLPLDKGNATILQLQSSKKTFMYSNTFPVTTKKTVYEVLLSHKNNNYRYIYILVFFRSEKYNIKLGDNIFSPNIKGFSTAIFTFNKSSDGGLTSEVTNAFGEYENILTYDQFLSRYQNDIIQIGIVDYPPHEIFSIYVNNANEGDYSFNYLIASPDFTFKITVPKAYISRLFNSTYYNIKIGRKDVYSIIDPNELAYTINESDGDLLIIGECRMSAAAPFTYMIKLDGVNKNIILTMEALSTSIPYTISEWSTYYANNSASINDGMATQHKYALEEAERNLNTEYSKATSQGVTGAISGITSIASSVINPLGAIFGVSRLSDTANSVSNTLLGAQNAYDNTIANIELEKELLAISYQNIKSAPNKVIFSPSDFCLHGLKNGVYFWIEEATNINDIKAYHNRYGYEYNNIGDKKFGKSATLHDLLSYSTIGALKHNYIVFDSVNFKSFLPKAVKDSIINILKRGVHLWAKDATIGEYNE